MVGHGGSSAGSYLADPTSPIPSHCASIVATSTLRIKQNTALKNSCALKHACEIFPLQLSWLFVLQSSIFTFDGTWNTAFMRCLEQKLPTRTCSVNTHKVFIHTLAFVHSPLLQSCYFEIEIVACLLQF